VSRDHDATYLEGLADRLDAARSCSRGPLLRDACEAANLLRRLAADLRLVERFLRGCDLLAPDCEDVTR